MKVALSKEGEPLTAGVEMPEHAVCPHCSCSVTLRRRRLMGGGVTYFWRHDDNGKVPCSQRFTPFITKK